MNLSPFIVASALALAPTIAAAEVKSASADGFFLAYEGQVAAPAAKAYADLTQIQRWWDGEHTYSGKASNLSLRPEAGGCFCEKWKDGSVEHGRVVMALPGKVLRLETALGPLQERALNGILSFWIKNEDSATTLTVEYRVNGASASGLADLAPSVDEVLGDQVARLRRYIATGNPEPPPEAEAAGSGEAKTGDAEDAVKPPDVAAKRGAQRPAKTKPPKPKAKSSESQPAAGQ